MTDPLLYEQYLLLLDDSNGITNGREVYMYASWEWVLGGDERARGFVPERQRLGKQQNQPQSPPHPTPAHE